MQKFLAVAGVTAGTWRQVPAMHPHYSFQIANEAAPAFETGLFRMEKALERMTEGFAYKQIMHDRRDDFFHLALDVYNVAHDAVLDFGDQKMALTAAGLGLLETDFQQGCTGYHIPEGVMFAYGSQIKPQIMGSISARDIAPSILAMMDISRPDYMRGPISF